MAQEIWTFAPTVPAGTPIATPLVASMAMPARVVESVSIKVPAGPSGVVGFQLWAGGGQMIPTNAGQWVIADGENIDWPLEGFMDTGAWQLVAYNLGKLPHTLYVRLLVNLPPLPGQKVPPMLAATALSS